jgi:2-dehydro-3-deoxygluconokinase
MIKTIATFGEIMLRISPEAKGERLTQANLFRIEPGGSESNVSIALSNLGVLTKFITKLPANPLSIKIVQFLRQFNVDTSSILIEGDKLGIYWTENGIGPRNSYVIYDRNHTPFSKIEIEDFNWGEILKDSGWFHFSGISPAISEKVYNVLKHVISSINIPYSVDLNYRSKLWEWLNNEPILINSKMEQLCKNAILIAGNESDFQNIFGIYPKLNSVEEVFDEIAEKCFERFPKLEYLSISNRKAISASINNWSGMLFVKNKGIQKYIGMEYKLESIEDRIGTGDSFVAGMIYGLINKEKYSFQEIIDFSTTLGALNHSTIGDASRFSEKEVWGVIENDGTGRIIR